MKEQKVNIYQVLIVTAALLILSSCAPVPNATTAETYTLPAISETILPAGALPQAQAQAATPTQPAGGQRIFAPYTQTQGDQPTQPLPVVTVVRTPTQPQPAAAQKPQTPALSASCLVGAWQVTNLPDAMAKSHAQAQSSLELKGVTGRALYEFRADGGMKITFSQLAATFNGLVQDRSVTAVQSMNGSATARYQVDGAKHQMALSDFGGEGIRFGLDINGQRLVEGDQPAWQAFTSTPADGSTPPPKTEVQSSRAAVSCGGDTLVIRALAPFTGPDVRLKRVNQ